MPGVCDPGCMSDGAGASAVVLRLVGVYDADHTLRGEITYWVGARLGRAHCSLCDITHGTFRVKAEWQACRSTLGVPFDTYHRDDQPADVRTALDGATPAVVAVTAGGVVPLLGPADLEACHGSPPRLLDAVRAAAERHALAFP